VSSRPKSSIAVSDIAVSDVEQFVRSFGAFVERAQQLTDPKMELANIARALQTLERKVLKLTWNGLIGDLRYSDLNLASMIVGGRWSNNQVGPLVYRNQASGVGTHEACISFGDDGSLQIHFLQRTPLKRTEIVWPKGVLESVERHIVGIAEHRQKLRAPSPRRVRWLEGLRRHSSQSKTLISSPTNGTKLDAGHPARGIHTRLRRHLGE
jgi:hypothetical protein